MSVNVVIFECIMYVFFLKYYIKHVKKIPETCHEPNFTTECGKFKGILNSFVHRQHEVFRNVHISYQLPK